MATVVLGAVLSAFACAVSQAQITSPLDIPGHVLWLDGDDFDGNGVPDTGTSGTPIVNWVDKSAGQGVNTVAVTNGAPTMQFGLPGSHSAVRFTAGSQDKLDNAAFNVGGDYTVFTVIQPNTVTSSSHVLSGLNEAGTDAVLFRTNGGVFNFYSGQTTGNTNIPFATRPSTPNFTLLGYQINSTGLDTGLFQSLQAPVEWNGPATLNGIRIGNLDRGTPSSIDRPEAFAGDIAAVVVYNRVLTPTEVSNVGRYLNSRYNLGVAFATGSMTQTETGNVTGGTPSRLASTSEPVVSGRVNGALSSNGGVAFAKDFIGPADPRNFRPARLNDGLYADPAEGATAQEPWIAATSDSFAGIKLSMATTIDRIGFEDQFLNRRNGAFIFEYTLDNLSGVATHPDLGLDPAGVSAANWQVLDVKQIQDAADTRHLYSFAPIAGVTGVRLRVESSSAEIAIAELEVWAIPEPTTGLLTCAGTLLLFCRRARFKQV